jgi:4-hydroxyphenylpyruvate dioxygenase-like putative hemolysin
MGPFPHDAPPAAITAQNPMGTDGFAFVELAHPKPPQLHRVFRLMGFAEVARHRSKAVAVYRQRRLRVAPAGRGEDGARKPLDRHANGARGAVWPPLTPTAPPHVCRAQRRQAERRKLRRTEHRPAN